eukprot:gnl/MRDRNA2_/MRDRNA2_84196_c0_seq1.p1 gnl/MRDRNA2_/MRDRNA2_84196_c0~~gnl/MRDRNA2_/MRDRNA2_84196_c0_seq1.p1  ORF type:complete len:168 (+),score=40.50 gnl/MRDRNA2_/MRDRNA2_84196_c0_seq1:105-608(+)
MLMHTNFFMIMVVLLYTCGQADNLKYDLQDKVMHKVAKASPSNGRLSKGRKLEVVVEGQGNAIDWEVSHAVKSETTDGMVVNSESYFDISGSSIAHHEHKSRSKKNPSSVINPQSEVFEEEAGIGIESQNSHSPGFDSKSLLEIHSGDIREMRRDTSALGGRDAGET